MARKKSGGAGEAKTLWLTTYADMVTLMLCFFVMLFEPAEVDITSLQNLSASISGDPTGGGMSLSLGRLAELGNNVSSLPSMDKGRSLGTALKKAVSVFAPDIKTNKVAITSDERGVVISLASDAFFSPGSADLNIEETREVLLRLANFLSDDGLSGRRFRIEGHTDSAPLDANEGHWTSNWELSSLRAINVLHYMTDFGVSEKRFSVAGYADTKPFASNDTAEGRAYNRRVDVIILDDAHF